MIALIGVFSTQLAQVDSIKSEIQLSLEMTPVEIPNDFVVKWARSSRPELHAGCGPCVAGRPRAAGRVLRAGPRAVETDVLHG